MKCNYCLKNKSKDVLTGTKYGNACFSCLATLCSIASCVDIDLTPEQLQEWLSRMNKSNE